MSGHTFGSTLKARLLLIMLAFFCLVVLSVGATIWITQQQAQDALIINVAGRQRMLVQEMTTELLRIQEAGEEPSTDALEKAIQSFDKNLAALTDGGVVTLPGKDGRAVSAAEDPRVVASLRQVRETWEEAHPALDVFLADRGPDRAASAVTQALGITPQLLLQSENLVGRYETVAREKVTRLRWLQVAFLASALILLGAGFVATDRSILLPLHSLVRDAERMEEGNLGDALQTKGPAEVESLTRSLNKMRTSLLRSREHLERRIQERTHELVVLHEVNQEINSRLHIEQVLRLVTERAQALLRSEAAFLCLLEEGDSKLDLRSRSGPIRAWSRETSSPANEWGWRTLGDGPRVHFCQGPCPEDCAIVADEFLLSHLTAALVVEGREIGALCVADSTPRDYSREDADLLARLASSAAIALENARLYDRAERVASLEERQRIAAEIHDGLAQTISYLELRAEDLADHLSQGRLEAATPESERLRRGLRQAGKEARQSIAELHGEGCGGGSVREKIEMVVNDLSPAGERMKVRTEGIGDYELSPKVADQVVKVAREAVHNALKHAQAKNIDVSLAREDSHYVLQIQDDGVGFDPLSLPGKEADHFGLSIMRARSSRLNGKLEVRSEPAKGTSVEMSWPVELIGEGR